MKAKRKLILSLLSLLLLLCCSMVFVACDNENGGENKVESESEGNHSFTVSFKVGGRNYDVVLVEGDNAVSFPSFPEQSGYKFDGWYLTEDFSGEKVTEIAKGKTGDLTLYAKFTPIVYTITYNVDGGTNPNTITSFTVEDKVVLADAQKSGYLFKGWKNGDEYMTAIPKGTTENIALTAVFEKNGYTIFYENVDGAYHSNQKVYSVDDETFEIEPANKVGYNFDGWYMTEDFSGERVTEIPKGTTGNLTLYAKFDLMVYTIAYENTKGAENRNENYYTTYSVEFPIYSFFGLTKEGYVFDGWYHGDTPVTQLTGLEWYGDVTLTAKWTPIIYSITYENEKGRTNDNPLSYTVDSGILEFSDLPDTIDYRFKGWSFMNGNVPTTSLDASILSGDIILTAMWEQKSEYKGLDYYLSPDESSIVIMGVTDTSITEIVIPDTTVMVLNGAFKDCSSLTSLTIPFFGFKRGATENTTIRYYFGDTVPATLKEVTVKDTNVPDEAFKDCTSIKTINLQGNIGTLGKSAFENCSGIFYVNFNDVTLTSIGERAFYECSNLLTLRLPEGLTEIGRYAFYKCGTMYSVTMPTSITNMSQIGSAAFWDCNSLYEIYNLGNLELTIGEYSDTDLGYRAKDVYTSLDAASRFSTDIKGNIFYDDATDGLTLIRYISTETTYAIPDDVTTIQKAAFKDRNDMVEITLNSGLKKIGDEAFMNATGFDHLRITQEGLVVGESAFNGCSTITSLEILADGVNLGSNCFSNCSNLVSINIDADNLNISDAFRSLTLPQTFRIKTSGSRFTLTFSGCSGIKEFILDGDNNTIYYAFPKASVESVTINGNNTSIEQMAFEKCLSLKTFTVNGGNCALGAAIFRDCTNLETITVTGGISSEIGGSAFSGCSSLKEFNYFGSLQVVGQFAFKNCTSLKNVEFGASLTSIGKEAFRGCTSLETVVFDESSTPSIEEKAFMGCTLLESVIFPAGTTKIGASAFMDCSRLYHVELPDNAGVSSDMFNGCKISVIALPASITKYVGNTIFKNCNGDNLTTVFYFGTPEQLDRAHYIGFKYGSSLYYYNESPSLNKTNTAYEGDYWHYDSNNEPALWNENTVSFNAYEQGSLQWTDHKIDKLMDGDYTTTFIAESLFEIDVTVTPSAPVSLKQFILTNGAKVSRMPREIFLIATDAETGQTVTLYNTNPPTYSEEAYGTNVFNVDSGNRKFSSFTFRFITKNYTESSTEEITIEIGEIEMVINPNDWTGHCSVVGGTAGNNGEGIANLTDLSTNTKWCSDFESQAYLIIRADEAHVLNGYSFTTGNDNAEYPGRNPVAWKIYGGSTYDYYADSWTEIASVSDGQMTDENNKKFTYTVDGNTTAYKYYKIVFTANGGDGSLQLSEIALDFS